MLDRYFDFLITQRSKVNLLPYELTLGAGRNRCTDLCHSAALLALLVSPTFWYVIVAVSHREPPPRVNSAVPLLSGAFAIASLTWPKLKVATTGAEIGRRRPAAPDDRTSPSIPPDRPPDSKNKARSLRIVYFLKMSVAGFTIIGLRLVPYQTSTAFRQLNRWKCCGSGFDSVT
jgi:hypothetical protein